MNNLLNMLSKLLNFNNQPQAQNFQNTNNQPKNMSDYPDTFFTRSYIQSQNNQNTNMHQQNFQQPNSMFANLLNNESLKNLLPIILGKNSNNLTNILGENNNMSQILSIFSKNNKKTDKNNDISDKNNKNLIDLSEYTEVN